MFSALGSQWRIGFSGATGLDYSAIEPVLRLMGIPSEKWADIFGSIQVMELEALKTMNEKTEAK